MDWIPKAVIFLVVCFPALRFSYRHPLKVHVSALTKAVFLWALSTSPVFASILLSQTGGEDNLTNQIQNEIFARLTISEMFIYSASFLSPVLYVVFDVLDDLKSGNIGGNVRDITSHLRGMQWVFLSALGILLVTLLAYSAYKANPVGFSNTILSEALTGQGFSVYIISLFIWYTVILWETVPKFSLEKEVRSQATDFSNAFRERMRQNRGNADE